MKWEDFYNQFFTPENLEEYKKQTDKMVFVSNLTGLSVNHRFVDKLDVLFWNTNQSKSKGAYYEN